MKEVLTPKKNNERRSLRKSARQVKMATALLLIMSIAKTEIPVNVKRVKLPPMSKFKGDPEEKDNVIDNVNCGSPNSC